MTPAGVDDVLSTVLGDVIARRGHDRAQRVLRADDQPELFARVKHQTNGEQVDFDVDDLTGLSFSTRSKLWAGTASVVNVSSRCRADTRKRPLEPLYRNTDAPRSVWSCISAP